MSIRRSGPVRSITLVKLTTSLAAVSPMIAASTASRAGRGSDGRAAAPSMRAERVGARVAQHRAFPQVLRQQAAAAPAGPATTRAPGAAVSSSTGAEQDLDGPARAQVEKIQQVGPARDQPGIQHEVGRAHAAGRGRPRVRSSALASRPVPPMPPSLMAPVVSSPSRSAPRWPRKPRRSPASGQVVVPAEGSRARGGGQQGRLAARSRPVGRGAPAMAPIATAGP